MLFEAFLIEIHEEIHHFAGWEAWGLRGTTIVKKANFVKKLGRLIFIHHQCWEVLPFCRFQRQRCIKIRVFRAQDFYTPLALKTAKGQHLPALVVYKNQSPKTGVS